MKIEPFATAVPALAAALALGLATAPALAARGDASGGSEAGGGPEARPSAPSGDLKAPAVPVPLDEKALLDAPVGAEDLLEISVFEIPDLTRTVRVSRQGTISLPLLGEILVGGLTPMELEVKLRDELAKKYLENPQVSVFVKEHGSKKVSVLGAVGKPGVFEMLGSRTLLQVLSEAGGLTKEAGAQLYVIRPGPEGGDEKVTVNVIDLMINRDPALNLAMQPGDIVSVPIDRPIYVYVDGAVKTPGRLEEESARPITLVQAIARAGGATERANLKAVQILRKDKGGGQTVLTANLNRIRKGKDPDPVLQDGDVVVVAETFF